MQQPYTSIFYDFMPEYHVGMATIHISEADLPRDLQSLVAKLSAETEIVIERGALPIAILRAPVQERRTFAEVLARMPKDSHAVMDDEFADDVQAAIDSHREPLNAPAWD
jgi:hypothetical protein